MRIPQAKLLLTTLDREENFRERFRRIFNVPSRAVIHRPIAPSLPTFHQPERCVPMQFDGLRAMCRRPRPRPDILRNLHAGVQRWKTKASFGPRRRHDKLLPTRGLDRLDEFHVFPCIDRRAVECFDLA